MFVSIASPTFDLAGHMVINASDESEFNRQDRRVSRTATLDGGAFLYHGGTRSADRTFMVRARLNSDAWAQLKRLHESYDEITCAIADGVFSAAIEYLDYTNGRCEARIIAREKISL